MTGRELLKESPIMIQGNFVFVFFLVSLSAAIGTFTEQENRVNRIHVHPRDPRNPCSRSFAPVYTLRGGGLKSICFKKKSP
jgi:hypothetical protein